MNRYPLWKYILIALAILISALYAVPNLFGEVPAVQVSGLRSSLEEALKSQSVPIAGVDEEENLLRFRFADRDTQVKARDAITAKLQPGYVAALNNVPNTPHWMQAVGSKPMYLGLDLRGGV